MTLYSLLETELERDVVLQADNFIRVAAKVHLVLAFLMITAYTMTMASSIFNALMVLRYRFIKYL